MKVLFDHNLPHKLRTEVGAISTHNIVTAGYMGWDKLKMANCWPLLRNGFEVLVTGDQGIAYEQNLLGRRLAVVALSTNNWPIIKTRILQILEAIDSSAPGSVQVVECGSFNRKKT